MLKKGFSSIIILAVIALATISYKYYNKKNKPNNNFSTSLINYNLSEKLEFHKNLSNNEKNIIYKSGFVKKNNRIDQLCYTIYNEKATNFLYTIKTVKFKNGLRKITPIINFTYFSNNNSKDTATYFITFKNDSISSNLDSLIIKKIKDSTKSNIDFLSKHILKITIKKDSNLCYLSSNKLFIPQKLLTSKKKYTQNNILPAKIIAHNIFKIIDIIK